MCFRTQPHFLFSFIIGPKTYFQWKRGTHDLDPNLKEYEIFLDPDSIFFPLVHSLAPWSPVNTLHMIVLFLLPFTGHSTIWEVPMTILYKVTQSAEVFTNLVLANQSHMHSLIIRIQNKLIKIIFDAQNPVLLSTFKLILESVSKPAVLKFIPAPGLPRS